MTKTEQRRFIRDNARAVVRRVLEGSSRWPAQFDGHELRRLLLRAFEENAIRGMSRARVRDFNNACLIFNLP